ncbi:DNA-binding transcriptional regulator, LysR family [Rhodoferax sp. OV413]|uniref:LysR family transcriptional regulator n=1 Tax=Rhodoferax sp. OV413 TaxID=1855285 RepID=UPI00088D980B|nr:LysR family transcriptional regulator [Rhodoferax sp. OV413]SDP39318.1 DNA-binding transcriptional regulator, LysR family [Rhodoferax sp. OV413]
MDQILTMRVFARVVEAGTFTKAADSLALPKATVTKQIQHLEARLRVKLLNRTTRRVTVTADGAAYYERTARLLADLDELEASMGNAQTNPQGRLRVDVGSSLASLLIIPALSTFFDRYPDIQLDLGVSDRPVDLIGDNVDCVIRGGELLDQSLVARRIGNLPMITVASPDYLRRFGMPPEPQALEHGHRMVNFFSPRTGRMMPNEFAKDGVELALDSSYRIAVNESNAYMAAALAGLGVSQMVTFMAAPHLADGTLVQILPDWAIPSIPIYVVYPPNRHLSAKVRSFVDWAADLFTKHPHLQ